MFRTTDFNEINSAFYTTADGLGFLPYNTKNEMSDLVEVSFTEAIPELAPDGTAFYTTADRLGFLLKCAKMSFAIVTINSKKS